MPRYNPPSNLGGLGAFLLILGMCSLCGAGIQVFGDRMPNPPPKTQAQFDATDRRVGWMFIGGLALGISGLVCVAASISSGKTDWRNQKRD